MCVLYLAINQHPDYPLIVAANRDEFYRRPTKESGFWPEAPGLLAGKDLEAGGSWMGVTTSGRFAAVTNIRQGQPESAAKSRGHLVSDYLQSQRNDDDFANTLHQDRHKYGGYNLIYGTPNQLYAYNNHTHQHVTLNRNLYGLSNADIDTPWPKTTSGCTDLKRICQRAPRHTLSDELFDLLHHTEQAPDEALPNTGVPKEWERTLSARFIIGDDYGTRASTVLLIDRQRRLSWHERSFGPGGRQFDERHVALTLKA